jgi:transposase
MDRQYVGIDFHRRRSVVVRMSSAGEKLSTTRVANDPLAIAAAGPEPEVVIEATYGWYWVVDLLRASGARVHLANPQGPNWGQRRVKNDERDAVDLADMLRLGRLPEAWIAPPATRELRELVRYRAKLVALRSGLKAQVHAVMAKEGVLPNLADMFGLGGHAQLEAMVMADNYRTRVESLRDLIEFYDREAAMLEGQIHRQLRFTGATGRSRRSTGSAPPSPPSWWPRLATSVGSVRPRRCARGPGSRPDIASRTPRPCAGRSPSGAPSWCAGR